MPVSAPANAVHSNPNADMRNPAVVRALPTQNSTQSQSIRWLAGVGARVSTMRPLTHSAGGWSTLRAFGPRRRVLAQELGEHPVQLGLRIPEGHRPREEHLG